MKKALIYISAGLNLLVLAAVVALYSGVATKFISEKFLEPSHDRWVSQFKILPVQPDDVVFVGDSITEGGSWHELFPGKSVRNRGISGDTTEGVLARLGQLTAGSPAKIFLLIGTNDLGMGMSVTETLNNIEKIVDTIRAQSPQSEVFVQSVLPRGDDYQEDVEALNEGLQQAIAGKAQWVDLYPLFLDADDGSIRDDLSNDELHLVGKGYLVWRDAIDTLVRR